MAASQELTDLIVEQLEGFGPVTVRRMFGGVGLFRHGVMFALISSSDGFFFRTDAETKSAFEAENLPAFAPGGKSGMPYYLAPDRVLEDAEEMILWAEKAFAAAIRADNKKPPSKRKYTG